MLNLKNPLVVLDLETTGTDVSRDRIVEIALVKVMPNGEREEKSRRINPGIPISPEATAVHGISNDDVKDCPTFKEVAKSLATWIGGADLAGFNSNKFDIPLLAEEFLRAGVDIDLKKRRAVDVQNIFHRMEPRTLTAAYRFYCGGNLEDAHNAMVDAQATLAVLEEQVEKYEELENDVAFLADFSARGNTADFAGRIAFDQAGCEIFTFGKYKGRSVSEIFERDPGYYSWMINGDFPEHTKKVITQIKLRGVTKG